MDLSKEETQLVLDHRKNIENEKPITKKFQMKAEWFKGFSRKYMDLKPEIKEYIFAKRRQKLFEILCTESPKLKWCFSDDITTDQDKESLQDWVNTHLSEPVGYSTGIDMIDAIWTISESDFNNGSPNYYYSEVAGAAAEVLK